MTSWILFIGAAAGAGVVPAGIVDWSGNCAVGQATAWSTGLFAQERVGFIGFSDTDIGEGYVNSDGFLVFSDTSANRLPVVEQSFVTFEG